MVRSAGMAVPDSLTQAEAAPLLGPDVARLREVLDALCLHDDPEVSGRALLRRTELRLALSSVAMNRPGPEAGTELASAIEDVQASGRKFTENSDLELRARLLAGRLLARTMRTAAAAELLHGTRAAVKGKARATRLQLAMLEGEVALESGAYMDADRHFRRAVGLARTPHVAHEHYQAAMSLAACAQLNANARGAIPWLRLGRATALTHHDAVRQADAAFALGNHLIAAGDPVGARAALDEAIGAGLSATHRPMAGMVLARLDLAEGAFEAGVQRAVQAAKAGAAVGNAAAFADGTILASQCQLQLGLEAEAVETLEAGARVLREQDLEPFAELVDAQREQLLRGEA